MKIKQKITILAALILIVLLQTQTHAQTYELLFNKNTYDLNENIILTTQKETNTTIELTYQKIHPTIEYEPTTIQITENQQNITIQNAGTYQLTTKLKNKTNTINTETHTNLNQNQLTINTFNLEIKVERTILPKNNELKLEAKAENNQGPTTYTWTLNDGTGTIKTGQEITHNFPNTGSHSVLLEAEDAHGNYKNTSITITIQDAKIIWVEVRSQATDELIQDATVDFGIATANTDNLGRALFYLPIRTYIMEVEKDQFRPTRQYVDVTRDNTYIVYLGRDREEYDPPAIVADTLIRKTTTQDSATLEYEVYDENPVLCEVYLKRADTAWKFINSVEIMGETKVYKTDFTNLKNTKYDWRIDCEDAQGNRAVATSYFNVELNENDTQTTTSQTTNQNKLTENHTQITKEYQEQIQTTRQEIRNYDQTQKTITDLLEIEIELNIAEKEAKAWEESLFRLAQEGNLEKYNEQKEEIQNEINEREKTLTKTTKILDQETIIITNNKQIFDQHYKTTGRTLSEKDITTQMYLLQTETFAGQTKYYTIIKHENISENEILTLNIPPNLATTRSEIKTKNSMKIIQDMTIEFTQINGQIIYYVNGTKDKTDIEEITGSLMRPKATGESVTGQSINNVKNAIASNLVFILLGLLTTFYVIYNFEIIDKIKESKILEKYTPTKQTTQLKREIKQAIKKTKHDPENSEKKYHALMIQYQSLTKKEKDEIYQDAMNLHDTIIESKMDKLQELIDDSMMRGDETNAQTHLKKMENIYKKLPSELQEKLKYKTILANFNVKKNN